MICSALTTAPSYGRSAAHPFFWKPKLRIPDIYENQANQRTFGAFLESCLNATREEQILAEMSRLAAAQIKGLGPSVAIIAYFLHPTVVPPFNTAMVKGFNALLGGKIKLGSWESYLQMRESIVRINAEARELLSKDLGAFAGLLYEIGTGRLIMPGNAEAVLQSEREKAAKIVQARHNEVLAEQEEESEHAHIQYLLIKVGRALHYDVYVARNDRHRSWHGESFALLTIPLLRHRPGEQNPL